MKTFPSPVHAVRKHSWLNHQHHPPLSIYPLCRYSSSKTELDFSTCSTISSHSNGIDCSTYASSDWHSVRNCYHELDQVLIRLDFVSLAKIMLQIEESYFFFNHKYWLLSLTSAFIQNTVRHTQVHNYTSLSSNS